jgi:hypothetical protein
MSKMLDPDVIFFNETGEKATRADMAGATPPEQGHLSEQKFRSVETWRKEGVAWKMIGSETLTLEQDPDPVVLDGKALDEYAGSYEAGASMQFTFARKGGDLVASLNGAAGTAQKARKAALPKRQCVGTLPRGHATR